MKNNEDKKIYNSSEVIRNAKISYRQLFHWELKGLLNPSRIKLGSREFKRYSPEDFNNARFIKDLLDEGYALPNIKMLDYIMKRRQMEEQLRFRLKIEEALFSVSSNFINPTHTEKAVLQSLKILANTLQTNRVFIFGYRNEWKNMSMVYEYCDGVEPHQRELQDLKTEFGWWHEKLKKGESIVVPDMEKIEDRSADKMMTRYIRSILAVPMLNRDSLFGFMGFADSKKTRNWSAHDINILKTAADIITRGILYSRDLPQ